MFGFQILILVIVCSLTSCRTIPSEPVPTDEPIAIHIVTTMPGNTEGMPGVSYTFRAEHAVINSDSIAYVWDFDTVHVRTKEPSVEFTFGQIGWYGVSVVLYRGRRVWGSSTLLVNIRGKPPQIEMRRIPAGTFLRGSTRGDYREQPVMNVRISKPLLVSAYEITQAHWEQVMGISPAYYRGENLPVTNISWMEAIDFCNRLSIRSGLAPCYHIRGDTVECDWEANGFRLPTEAEWEYAARAGTTTDVYAGNIGDPYADCLSDDTLDPILDRIAWYCLNSNLLPHPVGLKEPNTWGLYDIIGNACEFVWDWDTGASYPPRDTLDPRGPSNGMLRRIRGGSFLDGARRSRAAARFAAFYPTRRKIDCGFRIVRLVP